MNRLSLLALAVLPTLWACGPDPLPYGQLSWTFPENRTCATAGHTSSSGDVPIPGGITYVEVRLDGENPPDRYNCVTGQLASGANTPFLEPGTHTIELWATNDVGYAFYGLTSSLVLPRTGVTPVVYDLEWIVGGAVVDWQLFNVVENDPIGPQSCGPSHPVYVDFQTPATGTLVYGNGGDGPYACSLGARFDFLPVGTYQPRIQATVGSRVYDSASDAQLVSVTAGVFPETPTIDPVRLYSYDEDS